MNFVIAIVQWGAVIAFILYAYFWFIYKLSEEEQVVSNEMDLEDAVERLMTHNIYSPIEDHLRLGNPELGNDLIRLAKRNDVPLTYDLIRMSPVFARSELCSRIACVVLGEQPNIGKNNVT